MSTDLFSELTFPDTGFVPSGFLDHPEDSPPDDAPPPAVDGKTASCEVCGKDIPWSGRGRKPKFCLDHKTRTRAASAEGGGERLPRGAAASNKHQARLDAVVGDLQEGLGQLAGTIAPVAPVTAVTIALQGPPATVALVRIASDYPRFLEGLEMAAKAVPFMAIGKFVAAMMLALAVDMGRVEPLGLAAEYLGVATAAEQAGWRPATDEEVELVNRPRPAPAGSVRPPSFNMVT